jgi:hypothetical protein
VAIDNLSVCKSARHRTAWLRAVGVCVAIVATSTFASAFGSVITPAPAGAAQLSTLKNQAGQLTSQIAVESSRIQSLSTRYASESSRLAGLRARVAQTTKSLDAARARVSVVKTELRRDVVNSFVGGGVTTKIHTLVTSDNTTIAIRNQYLSAANANMTATLDSLHTQKRYLLSERSALLSSEHQVLGAVATLRSDRSALQAQVASERAMLSQIKGNVQLLVNQQQQAMLASEAQIHTDPLPPGVMSGAAPPPLPSPPGGGPPAATSTGPWGSVPAPPTPAAFAALRQCESGGNYQDDTGNGYYGAYQFSLSTWQNLGYSGLPSQAPPAVQDQAAIRLQAADGWGQWPACAAQLGLD